MDGVFRQTAFGLQMPQQLPQLRESGNLSIVGDLSFQAADACLDGRQTELTVTWAGLVRTVRLAYTTVRGQPRGRRHHGCPFTRLLGCCRSFKHFADTLGTGLVCPEAMIKRAIQLIQAEMVRAPIIRPVQKWTMRFMFRHGYCLRLQLLLQISYRSKAVIWMNSIN